MEEFIERSGADSGLNVTYFYTTANYYTVMTFRKLSPGVTLYQLPGLEQSTSPMAKARCSMPPASTSRGILEHKAGESSTWP